MHIAVCVKQVPDPEAAFSMLKVDEQAMEAALRIRESTGQAKITAVSVGPDSARSVLKHALAMGADEALLVSDALLEDAGSEATAHALVAAIGQLGAIDLVLTGRQAADWDAGVVGCGIGELMGVPVITFARKVEVTAKTVRVERVLADGFETIEAGLPAVVTVSNELGAARKPSLRETMRAARKPLAVNDAAGIGLTASDIGRISGLRVRERLYVPVKSGRCEIIEDADVAAQAARLVQRLREVRLI